MKTDSLFYRLFQRCPQIAMELLGLEYSGDSYRFGSEEIKQTAFRIDGIFKPLTDHPDQPIIFAEVQYQPDDYFYGRFFSEITLYLYREKTEFSWLALVIYPTRSVEKTASLKFKPFMDLPQLHRVYLEDYKNTTELSLNFELMRLIACSKKRAASVVRDLVKRYPINTEMLDFIETILVYKLPRLSREEIRIMLDLQNVELKQTRFYQEIAVEERQILLQHLLIRRFGQIPEWVQKKLEQANTEQLEEWMYRLLDAQTLEVIFKDALH